MADKEAPGDVLMAIAKRLNELQHLQKECRDCIVAIGELNGIVETMGGSPVDMSKIIQPAEFYSSSLGCYWLASDCRDKVFHGGDL